MGRTEFLTRMGLRASLWLEQHFFIESDMALFSECRLKCAQNPIDRADKVREAIYQQSASQMTHQASSGSTGRIFPSEFTLRRPGLYGNSIGPTLNLRSLLSRKISLRLRI